jgi:hypothetical protein
MVILAFVSLLNAKEGDDAAKPVRMSAATTMLAPGYFDIANLLRSVAESKESEPGGDGGWYKAADILGVMRDNRAISVLVAKAWTLSGRGRILTPDRMRGMEDYPAAVALIRIDLPGVDKLLNGFFEEDTHHQLVPAWVLAAMLPTDAAVAWIDAFEQQQDKQLNDAQRQRLRKLRETVRAIVHNGRPTIPPLDKELTKHPLIVQRAGMIETNLKQIRGQREWSELSPRTCDAVAVLGKLRATEAAEFLGQRLLTRASPTPIGKAPASAKAPSPPTTSPAKNEPLVNYPVAAALTKIGLPSVAPILRQVASGDQEDESRRVAGIALVRMMPPLVAVVFVDEAIGREQNELSKGRLKKLRDLLKQGPPVEESSPARQ